jgi:hypothetical protein
MSIGHTRDSHSDCPAVCDVLGRVGDTWRVFVMAVPGMEARRFSVVVAMSTTER